MTGARGRRRRKGCERTQGSDLMLSQRRERGKELQRKETLGDEGRKRGRREKGSPDPK